MIVQRKIDSHAGQGNDNVKTMASESHENKELEGVLQLPDGRRLPVTVTLDVKGLQELGEAAVPGPLLLRAVEVFGKTDKALSWLNTANAEFGGNTPRIAAQTTEGHARVLGVLLDLEYGFPA